MSSEEKPRIQTLGELKASSYRARSVREELRQNLILKLQAGETIFPGILGYEETVIPALETAILSRHHINLLGLRGQAKTRIARQLTALLDEWIPVIEGSEINDDPLQPLSRYALDMIAAHGDETPIGWLHRSERFTEKLATPDVSVADLIGDTDPIKAANLRLSYGDERVIHFGLVPRSHRCIFVINELPDLQARIQVALFNILQEGDIQIRGFRLRLPIDLLFVFTANPEDYTNRGSIVTPLKDRIGSQILTHYPSSIEIGRAISSQEAKLSEEQKNNIHIPETAEYLIEQLAMEARNSEFVDAKSGVSARLTISALENLVSTAERRLLKLRQKSGSLRMSDFPGIIPAVNGKIELVYEGEQEGAAEVARGLLQRAVRSLFVMYFPDPSKLKKKKASSPYQSITDWFATNELELLQSDTEKSYRSKLLTVPGLRQLVENQIQDISENELYFLMDFVLHGLAGFSQIGMSELRSGGNRFRDLMGDMLGTLSNEDE
jgi:magnesium chelatase subunit I